MTGRGRRLATVVTVALALACAAAPAWAQNHVGDRIQRQQVHLPRAASVRVLGLGYGHGHGMSQYGAEGMARHGWSASRILGYYYPHTATGSYGGQVAVRISADHDGNTTVVDQPGLAIRDLATGQQLPTPTEGPGWGASEWRMGTAPLGGTLVSYLSDTWHVWKKLPGDAEFVSPSTLSLDVGTGLVPYRGVLQSRTFGGARITVNVVDLESYVRSVVPSEMPSSWHPAALEAQAVAARSYATYEISHAGNGVYQLCDTTQCQVYGGAAAERWTSDAAVAATSGQVRTYGGSVALTQFSSSSGGWTLSGGLPYLVARRDPWDDWRHHSPHRWVERLAASTIEGAWPQLGRLRSITVDRRDGKGQWGGRVDRLTLGGSRHDVHLSGETFRHVLGLRSTWLRFTHVPGHRH